jgi:hypothetical protein
MRRLELNRAASFDDGVAIYHFGPSRKKAFTIIR